MIQKNCFIIINYFSSLKTFDDVFLFIFLLLGFDPENEMSYELI